ncbi:Na(+)/H(+) antiporter subunit B [Bacillus horti]|uniref:Monovalent cation:proton antiporter n=1 Tax=Caldalkalibacillus horti TaxID=77523 RepID=A0ABT9VT24_9BACI|nr:Na(+)/H(+) antiporter subunit B [Bacillus horti]MDQ0164139.1 monovalent cation:proton antiporter [Bacillus horti]
MIRYNDVMLQTVTKLISFIILTFAVYIFFNGHNNPGGGFIGGLLTAASLVLLYLAFDLETMRKVVPIDFKLVTATGLLIATVFGAGSFIFGEPFLSQTYDYFDLPILGENTELATALIFDLGVYLAVVGSTMTTTLAIGGDQG